MGRYLCLEPVLPVAMRFHASRSAVTSALASPMKLIMQHYTNGLFFSWVLFFLSKSPRNLSSAHSLNLSSIWQWQVVQTGPAKRTHERTKEKILKPKRILTGEKTPCDALRVKVCGSTCSTFPLGRAASASSDRAHTLLISSRARRIT